jgi:hypothetical protein
MKIGEGWRELLACHVTFEVSVARCIGEASWGTAKGEEIDQGLIELRTMRIVNNHVFGSKNSLCHTSIPIQLKPLPGKAMTRHEDWFESRQITAPSEISRD